MKLLRAIHFPLNMNLAASYTFYFYLDSLEVYNYCFLKFFFNCPNRYVGGYLFSEFPWVFDVWGFSSEVVDLLLHSSFMVCFFQCFYLYLDYICINKHNTYFFWFSLLPISAFDHWFLHSSSSFWFIYWMNGGVIPEMTLVFVFKWQLYCL